MSRGSEIRASVPIAAGVITALVLPLHLRGDRLRRLTGTAAPADATADPYGGVDCDAAMRAGLRTLRVMTRLRIPGFRGTCLYRSALHCLLLRRAGRPAVVRIGARRGGADIEAHAWVEVRGEAVPAEARPYAPLRPTATAAG